MVLKCITDISSTTTKDKEYEVIEETKDYYVIIADAGYATNILKDYIGIYCEREVDSKTTIKKIANDIADLVEKKNTDYNSSFDKTLEKYGPTAYFLRISDKLERAEQLTKNKALVKDEKIEDTLKDVIGYTLLYLNYMENHNE